MPCDKTAKNSSFFPCRRRTGKIAAIPLRACIRINPLHGSLETGLSRADGPCVHALHPVRLRRPVGTGDAVPRPGHLSAFRLNPPCARHPPSFPDLHRLSILIAFPPPSSIKRHHRSNAIIDQSPSSIQLHRLSNAIIDHMPSPINRHRLSTSNVYPPPSSVLRHRRSTTMIFQTPSLIKCHHPSSRLSTAIAHQPPSRPVRRPPVRGHSASSSEGKYDRTSELSPHGHKKRPSWEYLTS